MSSKIARVASAKTDILPSILSSRKDASAEPLRGDEMNGATKEQGAYSQNTPNARCQCHSATHGQTRKSHSGKWTLSQLRRSHVRGGESVEMTDDKQMSLKFP